MLFSEVGMTKLLVVSHKQLYFSRETGKFSSAGGFSVVHNNLLEYVDELHILAPIRFMNAKPKASEYLDKRIRIHKSAKHYDFINFGLIKNVLITVWTCINHNMDFVVSKIPGYEGLIGVFAAFLVRKRRILEHCGDWLTLSDLRRPAFGVLTRFSIRFVLVLACHLSDSIIVRSHAMKKGLMKFGIKPSKIGIVPGTTVEDSLFKIPRLQAGKQTKTIIFVGRLSAEKGLFDLVEAMKILRDEYKVEGIDLEIVGDGPLRRKLEHKVDVLGLRDAIRFTGFVSHAKVCGYLAKAWLLTLPSFTEGFPKVILEGMAAGRPVVATDVGGIPQVVENGVNGFLVEPKNPEALAKRFYEVLINERLAIKMGQEGRKKARKYDLKDILREYLSLIKNNSRNEQYINQD